MPFNVFWNQTNVPTSSSGPNLLVRQKFIFSVVSSDDGCLWQQFVSFLRRKIGVAFVFTGSHTFMGTRGANWNVFYRTIFHIGPLL